MINNDNSICLKIKNKTILFAFQFNHDKKLYCDHILPWAIDKYEIVNSKKYDFIVLIYPYGGLINWALNNSGIKFLISAEIEHSYSDIKDSIYKFLNNDSLECDKWTRYCPPMCFWSTIHEENKTKKLCVIDSGKYKWRKDKILAIDKDIGVDKFGGGFGSSIDGYHANNSKKGITMKDYAFYLSIERGEASDYFTEKINDAIICECFPIFSGSDGIKNYYIENSYINIENIKEINWNNWEKEYLKRKLYILAQKEILRTKFNIFSYFDKITDNLNLMDKKRPITL